MRTLFFFSLVLLLLSFQGLTAQDQKADRPETESQFSNWLKAHIPEKYPGSSFDHHGDWFQIFIPEHELTVSWGFVPQTKWALKEVEGLRENKSIFIAKENKEEWDDNSKINYSPNVGYYISEYVSSTMGHFEVGQVTVVQFDGEPEKFVDKMVNAYGENPHKSELEFMYWLKEYMNTAYPALKVDYHGAWYQSVIPQFDLTVTWGTMSKSPMALKELHGVREDKSIFIEKEGNEGWETLPTVDYAKGAGYYISKYKASSMGNFEVGKQCVVQFDGNDAKEFTEAMTRAWGRLKPKPVASLTKTNHPFMQWLYEYIPNKYPTAKMTDHYYWLQAHIGENLVVNWSQINEDNADLKYLEGHNLIPGQSFFIEKGVKNNWADHPGVTYFDAVGYYVSSYDTTTMRNWDIERCSVVQFDGDATAFTKKMAKAWAESLPTLKELFKGDFLIGGALNRELVSGEDPKAAEIASKQYNSATSENDMKWSLIHPKQGQYNWEPADQFMAFCKENEITPIGHTLVWKSQVPGWVFKDDAGNPMTREALLNRMEDHINKVVGRYKGQIKGWDVVNEALNGDGTMRNDNWHGIIGEGKESQKYDHIEYAFRYAHAADPNAELYYNDFNLDTKRAKCDGAVAIVKHLQSKGIRIDGVGIQLHAGLAGDTYPQVEDLEYAITSFAALGVKVMVTELDMKTKRSGYRGADVSIMNHSATYDPNAHSDETQKMLAEKYAELFKVILKHTKDISRVTLWGVYDGRSWISGSPLLFDHEYQPKEAFYSVLKAGLERNIEKK